mmetsp:Transcript_4499/g.13136  ORF Transcript_4499/g.13136 Transcript_4499/m.13136 type:complete len:80 (-) Transcript_4499:23-262(-)
MRPSLLRAEELEMRNDERTTNQLRWFEVKLKRQGFPIGKVPVRLSSSTSMANELLLAAAVRGTISASRSSSAALDPLEG